MPGASASRRSRLMVLRLRAESASRKSLETRIAWFSQWNCWSVRCRKPCRRAALPFRLGQEREVDRGGRVPVAEFDQPGDQAVADRCGAGAGADQEPAAGRRRERHRHLQFGIVLPPARS